MKTIEHYRTHPLIDFNAYPVWVKDLNHQFVASNQLFSTLCGIAPDSLVGMSDIEMPWKKDADKFVDHDIAILCGDNSIGTYQYNLNTYFISLKSLIVDKAGLNAGTLTLGVPLTQDNLDEIAQSRPPIKKRIPKLSKMEYQVLYLAITGYKREQIAKKCNIAPSTYDSHIKTLKKKFKVKNVHELIISAVQRGIYPLTHEYYP